MGGEAEGRGMGAAAAPAATATGVGCAPAAARLPLPFLPPHHRTGPPAAARLPLPFLPSPSSSRAHLQQRDCLGRVEGGHEGRRDGQALRHLLGGLQAGGAAGGRRTRVGWRQHNPPPPAPPIVERACARNSSTMRAFQLRETAAGNACPDRSAVWTTTATSSLRSASHVRSKGKSSVPPAAGVSRPLAPPRLDRGAEAAVRALAAPPAGLPRRPWLRLREACWWKWGGGGKGWHVGGPPSLSS